MKISGHRRITAVALLAGVAILPQRSPAQEPGISSEALIKMAGKPFFEYSSPEMAAGVLAFIQSPDFNRGKLQIALAEKIASIKPGANLDAIIRLRNRDIENLAQEGIFAPAAMRMASVRGNSWNLKADRKDDGQLQSAFYDAVAESAVTIRKRRWVLIEWKERAAQVENLTDRWLAYQQIDMRISELRKARIFFDGDELEELEMFQNGVRHEAVETQLLMVRSDRFQGVAPGASSQQVDARPSNTAAASSAQSGMEQFVRRQASLMDIENSLQAKVKVQLLGVLSEYSYVKDFVPNHRDVLIQLLAEATPPGTRRVKPEGLKIDDVVYRLLETAVLEVIHDVRCHEPISWNEGWRAVQEGLLGRLAQDDFVHSIVSRYRHEEATNLSAQQIAMRALLDSPEGTAFMFKLRYLLIKDLSNPAVLTDMINNIRTGVKKEVFDKPIPAHKKIHEAFLRSLHRAYREELESLYLATHGHVTPGYVDIVALRILDLALAAGEARIYAENLHQSSDGKREAFRLAFRRQMEDVDTAILEADLKEAGLQDWSLPGIHGEPYSAVLHIERTIGAFFNSANAERFYSVLFRDLNLPNP